MISPLPRPGTRWLHALERRLTQCIIGASVAAAMHPRSSPIPWLVTMLASAVLLVGLSQLVMLDAAGTRLTGELEVGYESLSARGACTLDVDDRGDDERDSALLSSCLADGPSLSVAQTRRPFDRPVLPGAYRLAAPRAPPLAA